MKKQIKLLELFGGIGAPRKALENLGYDVDSTYVEIDKFAVKSYNAMYYESNEPLNVKDFKTCYKYDILFHGSPCQDFSRAGKQRGGSENANTRSSLMWETLRIVESSLPSVVIWENVPDVTSDKHIENFEKYLCKLEEMGYNNSYSIVNASDFSIPQDRERLLVVSTRDSVFDFNNVLKKQMIPLSQFITYENDIPINTESDFFKKHLSVIENTDGDFVYPYNMTPKYARKPNSETIGTLLVVNRYGKFNVSKGVFSKITPKECFMLMGFDSEDYEKASKVNSNTQLYKQAGNSIVVPVLEAIFKELLK